MYSGVVDYVGTEYHDGHEYVVKIDGLKTPKCRNCGQFMLDIEALELLTAALYRKANLLTPEQIRQHRLKANMTQHELASALGVADPVVERWERAGQIQSRSLDNLLRLFFGLPQVREILTTQQISTLAQEPKHN